MTAAASRNRFYWFLSALLLITSIALSNCSHADERLEYHLIAGSFSKHLNGSKDYNETHHSLGLLRTEDRQTEDQTEYTVTDAVFTFRNSYDVRSYAYLRAYEQCDDFSSVRLCLGAAGGLTTGYKDQTGLPVVPAGGVTFRIDAGLMSLQTMYVPVANVFTAQFTYRIYAR